MGMSRTKIISAVPIQLPQSRDGRLGRAGVWRDGRLRVRTDHMAPPALEATGPQRTAGEPSREPSAADIRRRRTLLNVRFRQVIRDLATASYISRRHVPRSHRGGLAEPAPSPPPPPDPYPAALPDHFHVTTSSETLVLLESAPPSPPLPTDVGIRSSFMRSAGPALAPCPSSP